MNAYSNRFSDVLYDIGNPDLKAELTDMLNLTFNFKKHSSSLYYKHTPNVITEYFYVEDDITYHTNINYGKTSSVTLDYNYNDKPVEWWQVNFYIAGFYTHIPKSYNKTEKCSVNASWTNRFFINHIGELMFNINGYTSTIRGNAYQKGTYTTNISYSRSFFKNKLNFRIGINDIFNTMKVRVNNHVPTLNYVFYAKNLTQQFWCSITYNFSTKNKVNKSSVKNDNPILNRL